MAASSTNSSKESDNLNSKSDQTLESFDESQGNDLSPHLIEKQSIVPLSASYIREITPFQTSTLRKQTVPVNPARPFEEILVGQPTTDVPPGTYTKPGVGDFSSTNRP